MRSTRARNEIWPKVNCHNWSEKHVSPLRTWMAPLSITGLMGVKRGVVTSARWSKGYFFMIEICLWSPRCPKQVIKNFLFFERSKNIWNKPWRMQRRKDVEFYENSWTSIESLLVLVFPSSLAFRGIKSWLHRCLLATRPFCMSVRVYSNHCHQVQFFCRCKWFFPLATWTGFSWVFFWPVVTRFTKKSFLSFVSLLYRS